ncbi:PepSY-associated TM helix domain-containing protein [Nocardia stercoris]|uniref:PepSY-associated TM helix domain-containing protein n=1 Tax=Nocardia stercoris TaxID=2483361 RepID=UPI001F3C1669|nr:PepSY domain-containing protein [Nocardia stercoris]
MSTTDIPRPDTGATPTARPSRRRPGTSLGGLALRLHFYAGLFVAPFILIAALTGALYAIAPTVESVLNHDLLHVDSTGPARPLADQITAATATQPRLVLAAVDPAQHPGDTTRVLFTDPSLGESEQRAVFVDPATARPVGTSVVYGSTGALPLRTWIDQLHRNLHLGEFGRLYSELAASWLWIVALAGLVLWLRRARGLRLLWPDRSGSSRGRTRNWHATVGVWVLLPALFLSATGMTWSTYAGAHVDQLRQDLSWTTPAVNTKLTFGPASGGTAGEHAQHTGHGAAQPLPSTPERAAQIEAVVATARGAGLSGPLEVTVPAESGVAYVAKERRLSYVWTQDSVAVDGATGTVTDRLRFEDWPLMARLSSWGIQLHMGMLFGPANQLLLLVTMIALVTVIGRGYLLWWRRRPTGAFTGGRAPRRGQLRRTPPILAVPVVVTAAVVGWFVPLVGISLLVFLVVDVTIGLLSRRTPDIAG